METSFGPTYLGTTPPVSYSMPTVAEMVIEKELCDYLKDPGFVFESSEGEAIRNSAVDFLTKIASSWVELLRTERKYPAAVGGDGVQLRIYGSQRLGVHSPTADIGTSFALKITGLF